MNQAASDQARILLGEAAIAVVTRDSNCDDVGVAAIRLRRLLTGGSAMALLAGCGSGTQTTQLDLTGALAQVREQVDGQRQCAPLLSGSWPIELSADALAGSRVDALVAAGLVLRQSVVAAGEKRARERVVLAPAGERDVWLRQLDASMPAEPLLCYGRKQVVAVHLADESGGSESGGRPKTGGAKAGDSLHYEYRIVRPPSWTGRRDIRAAFPFLERELRRPKISQDSATFNDGKWSVRAQSGPNTSADLAPDEGFFSG